MPQIIFQENLFGLVLKDLQSSSFFFFFFTLYDFLRFYFSRFDQIIKTEMEKHEFLPDGVSIALWFG